MKLMYSLFDTLLEPVFILSAEQKIVYCNEPAALIVGQSARKICRGFIFSDILKFDEPLDVLKKIDQITEPTPYKELLFTTDAVRDGKAQITIQPVFDAIGDKKWLVFLRDVTLEERLQKKYRAELTQKEDVIEELKVAQDKLQEYNKNLEAMVLQRTAELTEINSTLGALLDSLGQGFLIFDSEGKVSPIFSKACLSMLEINPQGHAIWDVLKIPHTKTEAFKKWMMTLFTEMLPFADLAPLGPEKLHNSLGKHISLEYYPIRDNKNSIKAVVIVASDITSLIEAQSQAEAQKESAKLVLNLVRHKREIQRFIEESRLSLSFIQKQMDEKNQLQNEELYRHLHTLKGGSAMFSIQNLNLNCHLAESLLSEYKVNSSKENFLALRTKCLEISQNFEAFLAKAQEILGTGFIGQERKIEVSISQIQNIARKIAHLPGRGSLAERFLSELTMEPAHSFLQSYRETLDLLSQKMGKEVNPLDIVGGDLLVTPEVYSKLFASFIHALRNSIDHGIESPEVRIAMGKGRRGHISIQIQKPTDELILFKVQDDGAGISPSLVRKKLAAKGASLRQKSDSEVLQHIFDAEFSTREDVTSISGRGVGLNAIQAAAQELGGRVWVTSQLGHGTQIFIEVPNLNQKPIAFYQKQAA